MALSIKGEEADRLARRVADITGETLTAAVTESLRERLQRLDRQENAQSLAEALMEIGRRCAALPVLDDRSPDEIIGYNEFGVPE